MKYIFRIITLPFVAILVFICLMRQLIEFCIDHIKYGCEVIAYRKPQKTIVAQYDLLIKLAEEIHAHNSTTKQ